MEIESNATTMLRTRTSAADHLHRTLVLLAAAALLYCACTLYCCVVQMVTPVFGSAGSMLSKGIDLDEVFSGESSTLVTRQEGLLLCYLAAGHEVVRYDTLSGSFRRTARADV